MELGVRQAGRQAGSCAEEIRAKLVVLKVNFLLCLAKVLHCFSNLMHF